MSQDFAKSERLLKYAASKVLRRIRAAGTTSVDFEDVYQEMVIAWCVARDKFNLQAGVPFGAYLMRGVWNHINRWVELELRIKRIAPFELDRPLGEDEGETLAEVATDDTIVATDELAAQNDHRARVLARLSPRARQFIDFLESPPPGLVKVFRGLQARRDAAKQRGVVGALAPKQISGALVFDLMGADRTERMEILAELREACETIDRAPRAPQQTHKFAGIDVVNVIARQLAALTAQGVSQS